jgi:hypothetical protein
MPEAEKKLEAQKQAQDKTEAPKQTAAKPEEKENEKDSLLKLSEISLWLDTYDDIFSDFDPRPFSQRVLSDDFLREAKKASLDKPSGIELKFLIPKDTRNSETESVIKKRIRDYFKKHTLEMQKEIYNTIKKGILSVLFGALIMFLATSISLWYHGSGLLTTFLVVLLEPAGLFLFWEGFNNLFLGSKEEKSNLNFYQKLAKCDISFQDY